MIDDSEDKIEKCKTILRDNTFNISVKNLNDIYYFVIISTSIP